MQASGHTHAHEQHPVQLSGLAMYAKWYPRSFTSLGWSERVLVGQATTQRLQPLHLSMLTVIAPLIFAMLSCIMCFELFPYVGIEVDEVKWYKITKNLLSGQ